MLQTTRCLLIRAGLWTSTVEVRADCNRGLVTVRQLGSNPTSVDDVVVGKGNQVTFKPGQKLYMVNGLYPYTLKFREDLTSSSTSGEKNKPMKRPRDAGEERDEVKEKSCRMSAPPSCSTTGVVQPRTPAQEKEPTGLWSQGLKVSMKDPNMQVYKDEKVVVIKDKYPKARYHWLVLPWDSVSSLKTLRHEHVELLKHMERVGQRMVQQCPASGLSFRLGYHAIPSMSHVHLHVISQDFDSPCLKNKKHWNSFTTDYFIQSQDVITMLERDGRVSVKDGTSELLKLPLRCNVCHKEQPTIPTLKDHIRRHWPQSGE